MLRELIRKEILEAVLSFKFVVVFLTSVALILLAFLNGMSRYETGLQAHTQGRSANQQQMESANDWADLGQIGLYVLRKPDSLTIFGDGTIHNNQSAYLNINGPPRFENHAYLEKPLASVLQELDFISVVKIVLSLFALLFAYDAICGEKETGTLRLILANSMSRSQVVLGKILGRYLVLVSPLLVAFLIGLVVVTVSPTVEFDGATALYVSFLMLSSLIYLLAFYLLGLTLSALSGRSSISLILCLFGWICLTFIIPRVSSAVAVRLRPAPPYNQLEAQRIQLDRERLNEENKGSVALYSEWQNQLQQASQPERFQTQLDYQDRLGKLRQGLREKYQRRFLTLWEDYQHRRRAQTVLAANLSRISMSASYSLLSTALTRTGPSSQEDFVRATLTYHRQFREQVEKMIERTFGQVSFLTSSGDPLPGRKPDLNQLPKLNDVATATTFAEMPWVDMGILLFNAIFLFITAHVAFLMYDPR